MKGQPGYMIFAPVTGRFATATPSDSSSWRRLGPREKPKPGEAVRSRMVGAQPAYVWDASQTDGDPLPATPMPVLLEGEAPVGLWDGLAAQIEAAGFEVVSVPDEMAIMGANGMSDYEARTVSVRENMDPAAQVKTLAHELAHVLMHDPDDAEVRQHRGIREVEAESVALMVGAAHGMTTDGYTVPYVSTWAARADDKEPAQIVQATGERVRKAALAILDQLDTPQVGDGTPPEPVSYTHLDVYKRQTLNTRTLPEFPSVVRQWSTVVAWAPRLAALRRKGRCCGRRATLLVSTDMRSFPQYRPLPTRCGSS